MKNIKIKLKKSSIPSIGSIEQKRTPKIVKFSTDDKNCQTQSKFFSTMTIDTQSSSNSNKTNSSINSSSKARNYQPKVKF
jgi:hypothetical protein